MGVYEEFVSDGNFRVITDEREVYEAICAACEGGALSLSSDRIAFYTDASYPLYKLYSLNTQIEKLLQKTVWLDSGANILIESMETMTAIDVNSAKKQWKKSEADHILALNREAGAEIARQLRLRNISGMILIDFVNMTEDTQKEALLASMKSYVRKDTLRVNVVDITKLGLMELTREKVAKSLKQTIKKS
jgi:ribonuclease G